MIKTTILILSLFGALKSGQPLASPTLPAPEITQKQSEIPLLDLDDIYKDVEKRQLFIKEFGEALHTTGMVRIKNHHISSAKIDAALENVKKFFDLPKEKKDHYQGITPNRGYKGTSDLQEYWHVGPLSNPHTPSADWPYIPQNVWPEEIDQFQSKVSELYQEISEKGQPLLAVASVYMGKETNFLMKMTEHGDSVMRVVHYLPSSEPEWKKAHQDPNLLTVIVGASMEGLEVQTRDGRWVAVPYDPTTVVVSVSNMLESLSNGLFRSPPHRVSVTEANTSRYAIPFFYHVQRNLSIGPQKESILQTGDVALYPDQTAEDALKKHSWFEPTTTP